MPLVSDLKESRFLTKSDVTPPVLVTIAGCEQVNVAKEGAQPEMKWALSFVETEKPLILNSTNGQIIAAFTGSDNTDHWTGKKTVLYFDPNVSFAGKLVGGIRARAPKTQTQAPSKPAPAPAAQAENLDEDVPF